MNRIEEGQPHMHTYTRHAFPFYRIECGHKGPLTGATHHVHHDAKLLQRLDHLTSKREKCGECKKCEVKIVKSVKSVKSVPLLLRCVVVRCICSARVVVRCIGL